MLLDRRTMNDERKKSVQIAAQIKNCKSMYTLQYGNMFKHFSDCLFNETYCKIDNWVKKMSNLKSVSICNPATGSLIKSKIC